MTLDPIFIIKLFVERRVPLWTKLILVLGIAYCVSPIDFVMAPPIVSAIDDVAILTFAAQVFVAFCPRYVVDELQGKMLSVDPLDRHLDPPDEPRLSDCEICGFTFPTSELVKVTSRWDYKWLCVDCEEVYIQEMKAQEEQEE